MDWTAGDKIIVLPDRPLENGMTVEIQPGNMRDNSNT